VLASVGLPFLLKGLKLPPEPKALAEEDSARAAAAEAAIEAIEQLQKAKKVGRKETELYGEAAARVMEVYRRRIEKQGLHGEAVSHLRKLEEIERQLRLAGIRAERDVYYELSRSRELSDEISRRLIREADLSEARLTGS
jgi:CPA1 family monovalent cation:H+ antiporter